MEVIYVCFCVIVRYFVMSRPKWSATTGTAYRCNNAINTQGIPSLAVYDVENMGRDLDYSRQITFFTRLFPYFSLRSKYEFWLDEIMHVYTI